MSQNQEFLKRINAALALREIPDCEAALVQLLKAKSLESNEASVYFLLGLTYQDLDKLTEAEENYKYAYKINPESFEIGQAYGTLLSKSGNFEKAVEIINPLFEKDPKNTIISSLLANLLFSIGKRTESINVLQQNFVITNDENIGMDLASYLEIEEKFDVLEKILLESIKKKASSLILSKLGKLYSNQKQYKKAEKYFKDAISIDEKTEIAWIGFTNNYIEMKDYSSALESVEKGLNLLPKSISLLRIKGDIYYKLKDYEEAFQVYDLTYELFDPIDEWDLGFFLYSRDKKYYDVYGLKKGLIKIDEDIKKTDGFWLLISLKKQILMENKKYRKVLNFIDSLDKNKYEDIIATTKYSLLINLREYQSAYNYLESLFTNLSEEKKNHFLDNIELQGVEFFTSGEIDKSRIVFEDITKLFPSNPNSLNNLGFIKIIQNDFNTALSLLDEAEKWGYEDLEILLSNKGFVFISLGQYLEAIKCLEEANRLVSDNEFEAYLNIKFNVESNPELFEGKYYPDRFISVKLVVLANLSTCYSLINNNEKAFMIANTIVEEFPEDNIGYRILGNLHYVENDIKSSKKYWNKALKLERSRKESKEIKELLLLIKKQSDLN